MSKEAGRRQTMTLLHERPKQDALISRLVGLGTDISENANSANGAVTSANHQRSEEASPDQRLVNNVGAAHTQQPQPGDAQRLQERLRSAYVSHALAGLLPNRRSAFAKRSLDLALGLPLAALILALIAVLAPAMRLGLAKKHRQPGEPIFIRQWYVGRNGRIFSGLNIPALRATRLHSFASLPLIFNVIHGEMSLVGPRPVSYAPLAQSDVLSPAPPSLAASQSLARYYARPGLTGPWLAQRHKASPLPRNDNESARLADPIDLIPCDDPDLAYVAHGSFGRDLSILLRTPFALIGW